MAFRKQKQDYETQLDLKAEIHAAASDIEALMSRILERGKEFETAKRSYTQRAANPRNITARPQVMAKAKEASFSKKRCDLILHTLMHKVRAPGLNAEDWHDLEPVLDLARRAG
jgi:hypothetical protein